MSQPIVPSEINFVYRIGGMSPMLGSKMTPWENPTQSVKATKTHNEPSQRLNGFASADGYSDLGLGALSITEEGPEEFEKIEMEDRLLSMANGLEGIWSREDILSYGSCVRAQAPDRQENLPIPEGAAQPDVQETPEELASRISALIMSGMGRWGFQFRADYPTRTHFSGRAAKQGRIPWANRAQRAARAAIVLNNRNIKKAQLTKKRQDEREDKKEERKMKGYYNEARGKWLCVSQNIQCVKATMTNKNEA
ncbi:hypothetical protein IFR04_010649 [Cadophora malorum]|uniref:Uncharacterized protein n=1 Tax=Cadophora malorum TaxID=108018 RepID=A0A8H7TBQ0_9HELO|nr:hypothetical protein IFR04_010649 [Cadophora malorum]